MTNKKQNRKTSVKVSNKKLTKVENIRDKKIIK